MMSATRREIMRMIGFTPVVAPSALKELTAIMASPSAIGFAAGEGANGVLSYAGTDTAKPAARQSAMHKQVVELLQRLYEEDQRINAHGGKLQIESDIAALRSLSPTYKELLQRDRNNKRAAIIRAARKFLNANDQIW